jgi:ABC-type hemin transport system ATPase subunit
MTEIAIKVENLSSIIERNGSSKSTLLQMICGTLYPRPAATFKLMACALDLLLSSSKDN